VTETGHTKRTLASILVDAGIVTLEQVDAAVQRQLTTGRLIGETLVELGYTSEENIGWALSKQLGIPYVDIQSGAADLDLVRHFPESLLRRIQASPIFRNQEEIVIAMSDPTDRDAVLELRQAAGMEISLVIGCPASIRRVLDSVYGPERPHEGAAVPRERRGPARGHDFASEAEARHGVVWDRSGSTFLLYHVHTARTARASEVHFVPTPDGISILYRTDRGVEARGVEQPETALYLRTRLAHLGAPDLDPGATAAVGSVVVDLASDRIHVGVCHCRSSYGVTTVLRLVPEFAKAPDLSTLGLSPIGEAEIRDFVEGPEGLVIVYGPPRTGGSTVLASLAALASRMERRTVVFEPWRTAPYDPGATRIPVSGLVQGPIGWERLAVGLGADVVVLDDVLNGDAITDVLGGATVGRLVFARTDWLDGEKLLRRLAQSPSGRAVLRDRPFAMVKLPDARREGSAVWTTPEESETQAGLLEARILSEEERDRLLREAEGV
jgi:Type II secretion system (T2SS), protein E, N-terminal domain/Type II/IV secretion system protein